MPKETGKINKVPNTHTPKMFTCHWNSYVCPMMFSLRGHRPTVTVSIKWRFSEQKSNFYSFNSAKIIGRWYFAVSYLFGSGNFEKKKKRWDIKIAERFLCVHASVPFLLRCVVMPILMKNNWVWSIMETLKFWIHGNITPTGLKNHVSGVLGYSWFRHKPCNFTTACEEFG